MPATISYLRAFRPIVPSDSVVAFHRHAKTRLDRLGLESVNPMVEPRVYALNSLRVTLFERRANIQQQSDAEQRPDDLSKLYAALAEPSITTVVPRQTRPGVVERVRKTSPNPLVKALLIAEGMYLEDGEDMGERGLARVSLRASTIVDSTDADYKDGGTELALMLDENNGARALDAQRGVLEDIVNRRMVNKRLDRPAHLDSQLMVPFMVAPFVDDGQRDEFIDDISTRLPVFGIGTGPIHWQLKT